MFQTLRRGYILLKVYLKRLEIRSNGPDSQHAFRAIPLQKKIILPSYQTISSFRRNHLLLDCDSLIKNRRFSSDTKTYPLFEPQRTRHRGLGKEDF
jgi:hypothetical protein